MEKSHSEPAAEAIRGTVLVVDDEPRIRELVREVLEPCGFRVLEAISGKGALRIVGQADVDLLICDLTSPEPAGIVELQKLRAAKPEMKVLLVSGAFGGHFFDSVQRLGAHAGLKKPFSCDALVLQVESLLAE